MAQVVAPGAELFDALHGQGEVMRGAAPDLALVELRVLQERDQRPRRAGGVAEPEVPRVGIVVIDGLARQRQAEHVAVERGRALEVGADERHVMQPGDLHPARSGIGHALNPSPPDRRMNARRSTGKATTATTTATTRTASFGAPTASVSAPMTKPHRAA